MIAMFSILFVSDGVVFDVLHGPFPHCVWTLLKRSVVKTIYRTCPQYHQISDHVISCYFRDSVFVPTMPRNVPDVRERHVGLGGHGIPCSLRDPRFAGSNPAEVDGFFRT